MTTRAHHRQLVAYLLADTVVAVKWLILVVVIILTAPTLAKRFSGEAGKEERRGGVAYRSVRRYGLLKVGVAVIVVVIAVVVAIALLGPV